MLSNDVEEYGEWELCLMSELSYAKKLKKGKIYFEKEDNKLIYVVLSFTEDKIIEGQLDILVQENLTKAFLNKKRSEILRITSERGHTTYFLKPLEFIKFKEASRLPVLLYQQAQDFYAIFKPFLEHGYQPNDFSPRSEIAKPYTWGHFLAYMTNFHFCIELILKAIILTKKRQYLKRNKGHDLIELLKLIKGIDIKVNFNFDDNEELLLETLSECFNSMRYKEGNLQTRWKPNVFLETLKSTFNKIDQVYNESIKLMI